MPRETRMSAFRDDPRLNSLFNCIYPFWHLNFTCTFRTFFFYMYTSANHVNFLSFDNDDMEPSKRQVSFISLIFVLKCISSRSLFELCLQQKSCRVNIATGDPIASILANEINKVRNKCFKQNIKIITRAKLSAKQRQNPCLGPQLCTRIWVRAMIGLLK